MSEVIKSNPPGTAAIQPKYLLTDHVREVNANFVDRRDKKRVDKSDGEDNSTDKPPRKKLKGQNKRRPREKRMPKSEKLCFSLGTNGFCSYGENCCYSHDIEAYLLRKPKDISEKCYLFETFGRCPYSFSCRFALEHLSNGKNVTNEELWNSFKDVKLTVNSMDKEIQQSLRKRSYNFDRTNQVLKAIELRRSSLSKPVPEKVDFSSKKTSPHLPKADSVVQTNSLSSDNTGVTMKSEMDIVVKDDCYVPKVIDSAGGNMLENNSGDVCVESRIDNNAGIETEKMCKEIENGKSNIKDSGSVGIAPTKKKPTNIVYPDFIEEDLIKLRPEEIKKVEFRGKLYLAPLTTVGNLPFRRICKEFGADITCGEMALALSLLQGQQSEWALLKRHHTEDLFGVQICGAHADLMTRCGQLLTDNMSIDFIDVNMGCPLDMVYRKGAGCGLMNRLNKLDDIIMGMSSVINVPLTIKMRAGIYAHENSAHNVIERISKWGDRVSLITIHGRSREQRYTRNADWSYIDHCAEVAHPIPLFGSGDVLSYEDYNLRLQESKVSGAMIARGALIKPWIFKEIKEQKHWDISSNERFDILKSYTNYGLEHWGSDTEGVEKTRRFLLEWLSFLYRYIPVGILERLPQKINERPPAYFGRNELETLMASPSCGDWVKISEMLLGPVPENFNFLPKHKANAYQ